jgi:hypothetical protein
MHKWLEDYVRNDREMGTPGTNPNSQQSYAMAQQIVEHGLKHVDEVWGIEVPLYVPGLYAGTTDYIWNYTFSTAGMQSYDVVWFRITCSDNVNNNYQLPNKNSMFFLKKYFALRIP